MAHLLQMLGVAVALFASTNLDDIFVLVGFFADPTYQPQQIVAGQYAGIAALVGLSVAGSLLSLVISPACIGLLGIVAIGLGAKKMIDLFRREPQASPGPPAAHARLAGVALVTLANGADNISLYIPAFAARSRWQICLFAAVFACMTALWCFLAYTITRHPTLGAPIRRYARCVSPLVLIALGLMVMFESGTFQLMKLRL